jgi:hypothetical protein
MERVTENFVPFEASLYPEFERALATIVAFLLVNYVPLDNFVILELDKS